MDGEADGEGEAGDVFKFTGFDAVCVDQAMQDQTRCIKFSPSTQLGSQMVESDLNGSE